MCSPCLKLICDSFWISQVKHTVVDNMIILDHLPGGTEGYPAQPGLIRLSVRPSDSLSVRPSVCLYGPAE
jgi:hypothetical protein